MKSIIGIWCGAGSKLTAQVHGVPIWKRVFQRIPPGHALIPWTTDLDWMEDEMRGWRPTRCHPDERLAVRDLVVTMGADAAAVIQADCLAIDREEIALAFARVECGWEKYESPRVRCYPKKTWIGFSDTDEWGPYPISAEEIRTLSPKELEMRWARLK